VIPLSRISVILPVYNGSKYLKSAIDSILSQDFCNFEFLILDDGSHDDSREIVRSYNDRRIKLIVNERNLGLAKTLNKGIATAQGDYIARMDADDICDPDRLSAQFKFMEANPVITVCGCLMRAVEEPKFVYKFPANQEMHFHLLYGPPIAHPSAFIRSSVFNAYGLTYNESFSSAQDYELWSRLADVTKMANIDRVLMSYRSHSKQISIERSSEQIKFANIVRRRELKKLGIDADDFELANHVDFFRCAFPADRQLLTFSKRWMDKLLAANIHSQRFDSHLFRSYLLKRWLKLGKKSKLLGPMILQEFFSFRQSWNYGYTIYDLLIQFAKTLKRKNR
jgi:glycosyltransferase involved in cell wall biosynthesis